MNGSRGNRGNSQSSLPIDRPTRVPVETIVETKAPAASPITPEPTPKVCILIVVCAFYEFSN